MQTGRFREAFTWTWTSECDVMFTHWRQISKAHFSGLSTNLWTSSERMTSYYAGTGDATRQNGSLTLPTVSFATMQQLGASKLGHIIPVLITLCEYSAQRHCMYGPATRWSLVLEVFHGTIYGQDHPCSDTVCRHWHVLIINYIPQRKRVQVRKSNQQLIWGRGVWGIGMYIIPTKIYISAIYKSVTSAINKMHFNFILNPKEGIYTCSWNEWVIPVWLLGVLSLPSSLFMASFRALASLNCDGESKR